MVRAISVDSILVSVMHTINEVGTIVPEDDAGAVRWFRLAADQGYADAQFNLGVMGRDNRDKIEKKMTSADVSEAQ